MVIMYSDLTVTAQARFDAEFGPPDDFNHDIAPLFIYEQEPETGSDNYRDE